MEDCEAFRYPREANMCPRGFANLRMGRGIVIIKTTHHVDERLKESSTYEKKSEIPACNHTAKYGETDDMSINHTHALVAIITGRSLSVSGHPVWRKMILPNHWVNHSTIRFRVMRNL